MGLFFTPEEFPFSPRVSMVAPESFSFFAKGFFFSHTKNYQFLLRKPLSHTRNLLFFCQGVLLQSHKKLSVSAEETL